MEGAPRFQCRQFVSTQRGGCARIGLRARPWSPKPAMAPHHRFSKVDHRALRDAVEESVSVGTLLTPWPSTTESQPMPARSSLAMSTLSWRRPRPRSPLRFSLDPPSSPRAPAYINPRPSRQPQHMRCLAIFFSLQKWCQRDIARPRLSPFFSPKANKIHFKILKNLRGNFTLPFLLLRTVGPKNLDKQAEEDDGRPIESNSCGRTGPI